MIKLENVRKSFDGEEVLHGIDATFETGKCNLVIGKSGSGKTVLVKCIVGLFKVSAGHIYYNNVDITRASKKEMRILRQEIGMLFQGGALFDSKTVEENVRFPLDMFSQMSEKEKRLRVDEVLERVNLHGQNQKMPSEISGGMKKRVGIARAIVMNPKYLFCDEPNSGLDPQTSLVIDHLIYEITKEYNITTVVNTHDMNSVMEIGENIIFLHEGRVEWSGNHKNVLTSDNKLLEDFIFASSFLKRAKEALVKDK